MAGIKYWYVMYYITYQYFTLETNSKFASASSSLSSYLLLTVLDFWLTPKAYTVSSVS